LAVAVVVGVWRCLDVEVREREDAAAQHPPRRRKELGWIGGVQGSGVEVEGLSCDVVAVAADPE
jgi:hypothetical protein